MVPSISLGCGRRGACFALAAALALCAFGAARADDEPSSPRPRRGPALEEALAELAYSPDDPYLQYVALQLGRREGRLDEVAYRIADPLLGGRRDDLDLLGLFAGGLALQESLQLDAMRADAGGVVAEQGAPTVPVSELHGPEQEPHPWAGMLGGAPRPDPSLAAHVPAHFWFAEFRSLNGLIDVLGELERLGEHLAIQADRSARAARLGPRLKRQLAVETGWLVRPFYDEVVEGVALTGSDLFFREGTDLTVVFRFSREQAFHARMDGFLDRALASRSDAARSRGVYRGVRWQHVATPDRTIHAFSAYPRPGLHVRSNSRAALERVVDCVLGAEPALGASAEYAYFRSRLPAERALEDGFVYLSDPFIRRLNGPGLRLTELRRVLCQRNLLMLGHAAALFRSEHGRAPASPDELAEAGCCPGRFGEGALRCPCGGTYVLSPDGLTAACSHHGRVSALVPCLEAPVREVTEPEALLYRRFAGEYARYWREYFDPIGCRVRCRDGSLRIETLIMPLLDNSIYTELAGVLGGAPVQLDPLPLPERTIFSAAVRLPKHLLVEGRGLHRALAGPDGDVDAGRRLLEEAVHRGLGDALGLHLRDADPTFDLNVLRLLGELAGGGGGRIDEEVAIVAFVVASLNAPVFASVPVRDAAKVDALLERLDDVLALLARSPVRDAWSREDHDFYRLRTADGSVLRCYAIGFGPVRFRFFYGRLGGGLYVASDPDVLLEIAGLAAGGSGTPAPERTEDATGHGLVRVRARAWDAVLGSYRLGWEEAHREACLANLAAVRALAATLPEGHRGSGEALALIERLYGVRPFCPDGGVHELGPDGLRCSVHGTARDPWQAFQPAPDTGIGRLLGSLEEVSATVTFERDGLRAVLTLERGR